MKNLTSFLAIALLVTGLWSCSNTNTANEAKQDAAPAPTGQQLLENNSNRGKAKINMTKVASVERFNAGDVAGKLDIKTLETIKVNAERAQQSEDQAVIVSLFNNLLAAESTAAALDMKFSMSEEPIQDGVFMFTIESEENQKLMFEMYDEEGFEMSANNAIQLAKGANYKAINVSGLNNGNYVFKLKNEEGQALVRKVNIQQQVHY